MRVMNGSHTLTERRNTRVRKNQHKLHELPITKWTLIKLKSMATGVK